VNPPPNEQSDRDQLAEPVKVIAERLAALRREAGQSQESLGQLVGASQATVSRWEDPESLSTPSALELLQLSRHFEVEVGWLVGAQDHREPLPVGAAIIDQSLLDDFGHADSAEELSELVSAQMPFGTIWVQIPKHAEVVSMQEAIHRVRAVDRRLRDRHPDLWHEWAKIVLT